MFEKSSFSKVSFYFCLFISGMLVMRKSADELTTITLGGKILDLTPLAPCNTIYQNIANLGEGGRAYYAHTFLMIDFFYPITYALFYSSLLSFLMKKNSIDNHKLNYFCYFPLFAMVFDWLENLLIYFLLSIYPNQNNNLILLFNSANLLKFTTLYFCILIILIHIFLFLKRLITKLRNSLKNI